MSNLALYRKYRPKSFSEIVGQEHIVQTLTNAISKQMTAHAYLFSGPRGSGKTTIARLLAKSLNCHDRKDKESEPCNKCSSCLETKGGNSLDLIEIDAASHRGIDDIRELREGIKFTPTKEKYKVFILDEAHQLTKEAANALLKILEEPPSHAVFVLATTEIHKMLPTIISRCQKFDFRKLTVPEIIYRLETVSKYEKVKIDKSALELIALNAGGAVRDAESLLGQVLTFAFSDKIIMVEDIKEILGISDTESVSKFTDFLIEKKSKESMEFLNGLLEKGYDPQEFAKSFINYLRQIMVFKINPETNNLTGLTKEEQERLKIQSQGLEINQIHKALNLFMDAENRMKYSSIPQLPLELAIVDIVNYQG